MDHHDEATKITTVPLERAAARARQIAEPAHDAAIAATRDRLRDLDTEVDLDGDGLVAMGHLHRTAHGGSIRTFSGGLAHENGWWPAYKRHRNQHWEGETQRIALVGHEVDNCSLWSQSEPHRIEFFHGRWHRYTPDLEVRRVWGAPEVWELKRGPADLADPEYRDVLAAACEIYRRCGIVFRIVYADELFASPHHLENAELFASRRFARVGPEHLSRLSRHASRTAGATNYADLADALEPGFQAAGRAVIQALRVRRRIEIDLTGRLIDDTPIRILSATRSR